MHQQNDKKNTSVVASRGDRGVDMRVPLLSCSKFFTLVCECHSWGGRQTTETPCVGEFRAVTTSGLSMRASAEHSSPRVEPSFWAQLDSSV